METKHVLLAVLCTFLLAFAVGCGSNANQGTIASGGESGEQLQMEDSAGAQSGTEAGVVEGTAEGLTLTGTIDEIKDFMFIVTAEDGNSYALPFEEMPKGLEGLKAGDKVTVTYTGELSVVDTFNGEIISVEKVQ
ncbi:MAG: DUF1344 domain-containing protein [Roseburia sp.]